MPKKKKAENFAVIGRKKIIWHRLSLQALQPEKLAPTVDGILRGDLRLAG
ncbi:MAG: hypothetical protein AAB445_03695 [Patescibacteria group bacterium]